MLKFSEYPYERPNIENIKLKFDQLSKEFNEANTAKEQIEIIETVNKIKSKINSMIDLMGIKYTIDTTDEFYVEEQNFIDEVSPMIEEIYSNFKDVLLNSKFRVELEKEFGALLFQSAELKLKTFSPEIIEELQEENKLASEYSKLMASARIMFHGAERNLSEMYIFQEDKDREVRKKAQEAVTSFYKENEGKFDEIYDRAVRLRQRIAEKLGYDNFVQLAYDRLGRIDYTPEMVKNYRKQVLEVLVPLSSKIRLKQANRLGLESLKYYDEALNFKNGNAMPKGDSKWIIAQAKKMYEELSVESSEFINLMIDGELMDLVAKKGKTGGAYCSYISEYNAPFIFANFNGTAGDVNILTHEAGHAFQAYCSKEIDIPEYKWATLEACEIHSMGMEFITYPWMKNFFKEDVEKYFYGHISEAIVFIPYGVAVDEFQEKVYEEPYMTPEQRKAIWREIEKKYLPEKDYEDNELLEKGCYWYRQGHIFSSPFYYIDYTLAQVCAFQYYNKALESRGKAWQDYLALCKAGGSKPFLELLDLGNLDNPFIDGSIKKAVGPVVEYLESIDDENF